MISLHGFFNTVLTGLLASTVVFSALPVSAKTEQEQAVQTPVNELHGALLELMQNADSDNRQQRYALMETIITENFNTPLITQVILGRYWKVLNEQQRKDFTALFKRLTILTYLDRFDLFNNQTFKILVTVPLKKNRFMVKTELVFTDDKPVSFNYIIQQDNGQWKIISVIANGINDLSLKRAEYSSIIKEQGFTALVSNIEDKIRSLQTK